MSTFLIDYENINGLMLSFGLDLLTPNDSLIVFYSKGCKSIRKEYWDCIEKSGCVFSTVKLINKGNQFLDKYICTAVGEIHASGENEIAIISADKGYQAVIDYYASIGDTSLRIVKSDTIEQAMLSLGNPEGKQRRRLIAERSQKLDLDEISIRLKERESMKAKIKEALINTPYWFMTEEICDFVEESKGTNNRMLYTGALHNFGRENGRAVYNIIKEVV